MTFESFWDNADTDLMSVIGTAATYTPYGGSPVLLNVNLVVSIVMQPDLTTQAWAQIKSIDVLLSDVTTEPNRNDTFLIGSTTYTVTEVIANDGRFVKLGVK